MQHSSSKGRAKILHTLQRGLRLLEAVAEGNGEATAKRLSRRVGVGLGTCYNLLRTLQEDGYLVRLPGGRYGLGTRLAFLQDNYRVQLAPDPALIEILVQLQESVQENAYLVGWQGDEMVIQRYLEARQSVRVRGLEVGYSENPHARASTKAILAFLSEKRVRSYFAGRALPRLTSHTLTDIEVLMEDLRSASRRGYAVDREEFSEGVCCIGAAFFDKRAFPVGAFGVSVPKVRFDERLENIVRVILRTAQTASQQFGYLKPYPPTPIRNFRP